MTHETRHPLVIAGAIRTQVDRLHLVNKYDIDVLVDRISDLCAELQRSITERELKASLELKAREGR